MKKLIIACLLMASTSACTSDSKKDTGISLEALSYTLYTDKTEIFVEFKPLVVGYTSKFATHVTILGENFKPCTEGRVSVSLIVNNQGIKNTADSVSSPGIFRLALQPKEVGIGQIIFDIVTPDYTDKIIIDSVRIYPDLKTAQADNSAKDGNGSEISYLKEQAWKIDFANTLVKLRPFQNVVHTSGQIISAPGDKSTVVAKADGVVKFASANIVAGASVSRGQALFSLTGGGVTNNIDAAIITARSEYNKSKNDYERANELIKDQLISKKEYEEIKLRYQTAQTQLNNLSANYSTSGKVLIAPISGYITDISVSDGQFVSAGQNLASISQNRKILLRADVSQRELNKLNKISRANFITQGDEVYTTSSMNGRLLSVGKSTGENSLLIPIVFEMDNISGLVPGLVVEVFLLSDESEYSMVLPVSALIEEQGKFYAYVQTEGESFEKRELQLGANNGREVQVLKGILPGERVVTKGAYQIKLATASGTMPAHGHEH